MDVVVGNITSEIKTRGMWERTLLVRACLCSPSFPMKVDAATIGIV